MGGGDPIAREVRTFDGRVSLLFSQIDVGGGVASRMAAVVGLLSTCVCAFANFVVMTLLPSFLGVHALRTLSQPNIFERN